MKYLQQREDGSFKELAALSESDHICKCCDSISHYKEVGGVHHDDAVCEACSSLCSCKCHRPEVKKDD